MRGWRGLLHSEDLTELESCPRGSCFADITAGFARMGIKRTACACHGGDRTGTLGQGKNGPVDLVQHLLLRGGFGVPWADLQPGKSVTTM